MRAYVLERLVEDRLLADAEFRERLRRLPEPGRRLLLWLLEQQDVEREIQADDDLTRRRMRTKIAELRRRPVGPLSELEETVIREALANDDGRIAPARTGESSMCFCWRSVCLPRRPAPDGRRRRRAYRLARRLREPRACRLAQDFEYWHARRPDQEHQDATLRARTANVDETRRLAHEDVLLLRAQFEKATGLRRFEDQRIVSTAAGQPAHRPPSTAKGLSANSSPRRGQDRTTLRRRARPIRPLGSGCGNGNPASHPCRHGLRIAGREFAR